MPRNGFSKRRASPANSGASAAERPDVTEDAVLGGRLVLRQPRKGHRVGHDAMLLAAACSARPRDRLIELGAGVGAAGLAVAQRVGDLALTLIEIDPALAALARENAERNGLAERTCVICLDVHAPPADFAAAGLSSRGEADHVLMNPPFNDPSRQRVSPDQDRHLAHAAPEAALADWVAAAAWLVHSAGMLTMIWRADGLAHVLASVSKSFGGLVVLPVHGRAGEPAIRILVQATKGSSAPLKLLPGFMLNDRSGRPTAEAEAVLRAAAALPMTDG